MPHAKFITKQNDTTPPIEVVLVDSNGFPVNLTGATVVFHMRVRPAGAVKVNGSAATIVGTASNGRVRYNLTASDRDTADIYEAEFQVTFADGTIQSFPGEGYIIVDIQDDIA